VSECTEKTAVLEQTNDSQDKSSDIQMEKKHRRTFMVKRTKRKRDQDEDEGEKKMKS